MNNLRKIVTATFLLFNTSASVANDPLKVGYVYADEISDYGWTYQHDVSRKKVEKKLGDAISSDYVITSKADAKSTIDDMVKNKYDMIFITSIGLKDVALKAARAHPNVKFTNCNSNFKLNNLGSYAARYDQGFYLAGIASAKLSKSKVLGSVGILHTPLVYRNVNAFTLGAQSVDPSIKVKIIWIDARMDTVAETEAVRELKRSGADVVLQQTINPTVMKVAEEENMWVVGFNGLAKKYAPTKHVVSVINDWSFYYEKEVKSALKGTWEPTIVWDGFRQGMVKMTSFNPAVSKDEQAKIRDMRTKMSQGKFDPFTGPISYADGKAFLQKGKVASFNELVKMKKFIKGVEDITN